MKIYYQLKTKNVDCQKNVFFQVEIILLVGCEGKSEAFSFTTESLMC